MRSRRRGLRTERRTPRALPPRVHHQSLSVQIRNAVLADGTIFPPGSMCPRRLERDDAGVGGGSQPCNADAAASPRPAADAFVRSGKIGAFGAVSRESGSAPGLASPRLAHLETCWRWRIAMTHDSCAGALSSVPNCTGSDPAQRTNPAVDATRSPERPDFSHKSRRTTIACGLRHRRRYFALLSRRGRKSRGSCNLRRFIPRRAMVVISLDFASNGISLFRAFSPLPPSRWLRHDLPRRRVGRVLRFPGQ